ncbi:MAG: hypothetical protein ACM3UL_01965 [Ignavibacteria bacterium]
MGIEPHSIPNLTISEAEEDVYLKSVLHSPAPNLLSRSGSNFGGICNNTIKQKVHIQSSFDWGIRKRSLAKTLLAEKSLPHPLRQ